MRKSSDARVLERLLESVAASLNEDAARKLIGLRADRELQARIDILARKNNEGELTSAEHSEYDRYVLVGDVVAILQAQARMFLGRPRRPS
jgi:hypothetical protein